MVDYLENEFEVSNEETVEIESVRGKRIRQSRAKRKKRELLKNYTNPTKSLNKRPTFKRSLQESLEEYHND